MATPSFCTRCYMVGPSKRHIGGSFFIELFLWLCFFVPGIIYSIWRLTTRQQVCRACGSAELVPPTSDRARMMMAGPQQAYGPPPGYGYGPPPQLPPQ